MARKAEVELHEKKDSIIKELLKQTPYRKISERYGVSVASLHRYLHTYLVPKAAKEEEKKESRDGKYVLKEIDRLMERMNKLYDACDSFLSDPDDPGRYFLGPRAHEIEVTYAVRGEDGKMSRPKKERLHVILSRLEESGELKVLDHETRIADPRTLIIRTSEAIGKHLELLSKIHGLVVEHITINNVERWTELKTIILQATAKNPEIRERIVAGLKKIIGEGTEA